MGWLNRKEKSKEWYNKEYKKETSYNIPLESSPFFVIYKQILSFMSSNKNTRILELGCGTGRLAKLLVNNGYKKYTGVDISEVAINKACEYVPEVNFINNSFFSKNIKKIIPSFNTFILVEVLEHIVKDIELLSLFPSGSNVLFSVPSSKYYSHVRCFVSKEEVFNRYGFSLDFKDYKVITTRKKSKLFICKTVKK